MQKVLLDTNSLIYAIRNRIDLEYELKGLPEFLSPAVPECVVAELRGLGTTKWYAKAALEYSKRFECVRSTGEGDFCIMMTAVHMNAAVLTNDRHFLKKLKNRGIRCMTLTGEHRIQFY
jgi:rRNA-processing protein FCF1